MNQNRSLSRVRSRVASNPYVIGPLAISSPNGTGSAITVENLAWIHRVAAPVPSGPEV
jgi:hypothetical protein